MNILTESCFRQKPAGPGDAFTHGRMTEEFRGSGQAFAGDFQQPRRQDLWCGYGQSGESSGQAILSVGDDVYLLRTRHLVIESEGYAVRSMQSMDVTAEDVAHSMPLAILCHTVPIDRMLLIRSALRQVRPDLPILNLGCTHVALPGSGDHVLGMLDGPANLLCRVEQILMRSLPDCRRGTVRKI